MVNEHVGFTLDVLPGTLAGITAALGGFNELVAATSMFATAVGRSTSVVDSMILTLGVGLAGAAWESAKAFGEVERSMKIVQAVSGQTSSEISVLTQKANEFSVKYKMGIDDMTAGLQTLGRAGLSSVNTQIDTLQAGLQAAKTQGIALDDALNKIVQTTSLLGGDINASNFGQQAQDLTSKILATAMSAPIDMNDVVQTLSYSGGTAAAAGINIQNPDALYDYLGAVSSFAQKGVTGSMAGTAMRAFFTKPASQDTSVVEALNKLDMKASDLWEAGGNKMRPVSEQIGLIHQQMDKLHMSTLDQIELWGKIVGPKMGQQMMKLDENAIKNNARNIRETASAEDLAATTMKNFMSELEELTQRGQKTWREYGNVAIAWIEPVIRGINGLYDIIDSFNLGGVPIIQQIVKAGIILLISQVIQRLGAVWNLFKNVGAEIKSILATGSQSQRTTEQLVAEEQKRLQELGLTEQQAKTLANDEKQITSNLSVSNKVLAEFLAKLNEAVTLMAELANLSRIQSMSQISTISAAQHNRVFMKNGTEGMRESAWFPGMQKGDLTRNEFAALALRHGMNIEGKDGLLNIYKSKDFQQFWRGNQSAKSTFPTAISLEKYLQENQKGIYDPKTNPLIGIVQGVKTDTDKLVQEVAVKTSSSSNTAKTSPAITTARTNTTQNTPLSSATQQQVLKSYTDQQKTAEDSKALIKNNAEKITSEVTNDSKQALTIIRERLQNTPRYQYMRNPLQTSSNKQDIEQAFQSLKGIPLRFDRKYFKVPITDMLKGKSAEQINAENLQRPKQYIRESLSDRRAFFDRRPGKKYYMTNTYARNATGFDMKYRSLVQKKTEDRLATAQKNLSNNDLSQQEREILTRKVQREQEILNHISAQRNLMNQLQADLSKITIDTENYEHTQEQILIVLDKYYQELVKQEQNYKMVTQALFAQKEAIDKDIQETEKQLNKKRLSNNKRNALEEQLTTLKNQQTMLEEDIVYALTLQKDFEVSINKTEGIAKTLQVQKLEILDSEILLAEESLMKKYDELEDIDKQLRSEKLINAAMMGHPAALETIEGLLLERAGIEEQIAQKERAVLSKIPAANSMNGYLQYIKGQWAPKPTTQYKQPIGPAPAYGSAAAPIRPGLLDARVLTEAGIKQMREATTEQAKAVLKNPVLSSQSVGYGSYLSSMKTTFTSLSKISIESEKQATNAVGLTNEQLENRRLYFRLKAATQSQYVAMQQAGNRAGLIVAELESRYQLEQGIKTDLTAERSILSRKRRALSVEGADTEAIAAITNEIKTIDEQIAVKDREILTAKARMVAAQSFMGRTTGPTALPTGATLGSRYMNANSSDIKAINNLNTQLKTTNANINKLQYVPLQSVQRQTPYNAASGFSQYNVGHLTAAQLTNMAAQTAVNASFRGAAASAFNAGLVGRTNFDKDAGMLKNWFWNSGMMSMVNKKAITEATSGMGRLGKIAGVAGGALGSFTMMFGPLEVAMLAFSLIMQGIQKWQQNYQEQLEKINSELSEARENIQKAEEAFTSAYDEANPKATQEEKDEALLVAYSGDTSASADDGLQTYRDKLFGAVTQIEVNTRKQATQENDFMWGESGWMQKHVWSRLNELGGAEALLVRGGALEIPISMLYPDETKADYEEKLKTQTDNAQVLGLSDSNINKADDIVNNLNKYLGTATDKLDGTLNHYPDWIADMEDKSDQAKYARSIMASGIDSLGPTQGDAYAGIWGSNRDVASYYRMQRDAMALSSTEKTRLMNAINDDADFFTSMQKLYFKNGSKNGKLVGNKDNEAKILKAIQHRLGNISSKQAQIALTLSAVADIQKVVSEQIQPTLMSHMEAAWSSVGIQGATGQTLGQTWNTTSAVQQGVAIISAQMARLLQQKAMELGSMQAELAGIDMKDLDELRLTAQNEPNRTGVTINGHSYDKNDIDNAAKIFSAMETSPYEAIALQKGETPDKARAFGERMKTLLDEQGKDALAVMATQAKGLQYFLEPVITQGYIDSLKDSDAQATGPESTGKDKNKSKDKDSSSNRKNWVNLAICNKKEIPKLNVNLFKKPPNFTILNRNFKLRDVNVNTADDAKSIQNAVKNSIIEIQNRSNPKIIQDDAAEYDPVNATDGNTLPVGTKKTE